MSSAGIEPASFRFVTLRINHCATAVPNSTTILGKIYGPGLRHQEAFLGLSLSENTISNKVPRITPRPLSSVTIYSNHSTISRHVLHFAHLGIMTVFTFLVT